MGDGQSKAYKEFMAAKRGCISHRTSSAFVADRDFEDWAYATGTVSSDFWFDTALVGVLDPNESGKSRQHAIAGCKPRDAVVLLRDLPFDREKVAVYTMNHERLGYLNETAASQLPASINAGDGWIAVVRHLLHDDETNSLGLVIVLFKLSAEWIKKNGHV